jgi:DNA-binding NtrC family response regulator
MLQMPDRTALLIVEDDAAIRDALRVVRPDDWDAICVKSLLSARLLLGGARWDALLLDVQLDGGRGEDLLADLAFDRCRAVPVVVVSAEVGTVRTLAARYGVPLVTKPFDVDRLREAVRTAILADTRPSERIRRTG